MLFSKTALFLFAILDQSDGSAINWLSIIAGLIFFGLGTGTFSVDQFRWNK